jgi:hypothetical protein
MYAVDSKSKQAPNKTNSFKSEKTKIFESFSREKEVSIYSDQLLVPAKQKKK